MNGLELYSIERLVLKTMCKPPAAPRATSVEGVVHTSETFGEHPGATKSYSRLPGKSLRVICATRLPWKRAMPSSLGEGWRLPSPPAMLLAP